VLGATAGTCYGFTARLALVTASDWAGASDRSVVSGVTWRAEVAGPPTDLPTWPPDERLVASLDTFANRGTRGSRLDLFISRSAGAAESVSYAGRVQLPDEFGGFQDGDGGRIILWVSTPKGAFGPGGIRFRLRVGSDGLEIEDIRAEPSPGCPE
jgi:hypothetical protein